MFLRNSITYLYVVHSHNNDSVQSIFILIFYAHAPAAKHLSCDWNPSALSSRSLSSPLSFSPLYPSLPSPSLASPFLTSPFHLLLYPPLHFNFPHNPCLQFLCWETIIAVSYRLCSDEYAAAVSRQQVMTLQWIGRLMMMMLMIMVRMVMLLIFALVGPSAGTLMNEIDKQSIIDQINRLREFAKSSNMAEEVTIATDWNKWVQFPLRNAEMFLSNRVWKSLISNKAIDLQPFDHFLKLNTSELVQLAFQVGKPARVENPIV